MTKGRPWHKERLFFLISAARHFAQSLEEEGFSVEYVKAATTIDGLKTISPACPSTPKLISLLMEVFAGSTITLVEASTLPSM
jgi:deoxyribodipyrimidine photolyase-related protein